MIQLEKVFKAFANKRRLMIIKFLKGRREASVAEIAAAIKLSLKSTSRHLSILFSNDVVEKEQRRLQVYYYLPAKPAPLIKHLLSVV